MQAFVIASNIVNAYKREPINREIINYQKVLLILRWCSNDNNKNFFITGITSAILIKTDL
jgi:hypothetical protein